MAMGGSPRSPAVKRRRFGRPEEPDAKDGAEAFATPADGTSPPRSSAPESGVSSLSDLTLIRPINRGAHSKVWLALRRNSADRQYVALKVLSKARLLRAGPAEVQSVMREKRALLSTRVVRACT